MQNIDTTFLCFLQSTEQNSSLSKPVTNLELVEEFIAWKRTHSPWAAERYQIWVNRFQQFVNKAPEELKFQDFVAFSDSIRDEYAPMSVQYAHNIIHNYLRFYMEQGRLGFPLYFVRVPRARAESHYSITPSEYQVILSVLTSQDVISLRNHAIVRLLHDTGMRVGELVSLETDGIGNDLSAVILTEKTVRQRRVFWTSETDEVVQRYLASRKAMNNETKALFVGIGGGQAGFRLSCRSVERVIKQLCKRAQVTDRICPHSFRHAFIHRMARKGLPDAIIARMVGHTTPHTVSHYTQLSRPEMEAFYREGSGEKRPS